jgi:hypothetical protein
VGFGELRRGRDPVPRGALAHGRQHESEVHRGIVWLGRPKRPETPAG